MANVTSRSIKGIYIGRRSNILNKISKEQKMNNQLWLVENKQALLDNFDAKGVDEKQKIMLGCFRHFCANKALATKTKFVGVHYFPLYFSLLLKLWRAGPKKHLLKLLTEKLTRVNADKAFDVFLEFVTEKVKNRWPLNGKSIDFS